MKAGFAIWFTGLPRSAKTTLSKRVEEELRMQGHRIQVLDGDEVRERLTPDLGFTREDRDENISRISYVAKLLVQNGVVVIVAAISPYTQARAAARQDIGHFFEVYVSCPVESCMERDYKGLYKRAILGEIPNFTGVSDPYEPPPNPEVVVDTDRESVDESVDKIMAALQSQGCLDSG